MGLIMNLKDIEANIVKIAKTGAVLDALIQTTGVGVLVHFAEHHDAAIVNRLFLALPAGSRKTAFASWLLAYGAVMVNTDQAMKKERPFLWDKDKVTTPEAAAEDMWYNHKPEKAIDETFDLQKAVRALLKRAGTAGKLEHGDGDTLKALAKCVGIAESDVPTRPKAAVPPANLFPQGEVAKTE